MTTPSSVSSNGTLFAFLEWSRYRKSVDGGQTWGEARLIGPPVATWRMHVNPDPFDRDLLHLVMATAGEDDAGARRLFYVSFDMRTR